MVKTRTVFFSFVPWHRWHKTREVSAQSIVDKMVQGSEHTFFFVAFFAVFFVVFFDV